MGLSVDVVKRSGHRPSEAFNKEKLLQSIRAACLSVRTPEGEADLTARNVTNAVILWCTPRSIITSNDLRRIASEHLNRYHSEAAYFYQHHRSIM
ncbi:hypothetical protein KC953_02835 [Candidatus Saccharibacteria bacterium]|nr:hypothetical protein [Candidatus Saccharibacteria bacterium]